MEPRFEHDCDRCLFIGRYADADIYRCDQEVLATEVGVRKLPTLIARYSSDGPDYTSGPEIDVGDLVLRLRR